MGAHAGTTDDAESHGAGLGADGGAHSKPFSTGLVLRMVMKLVRLAAKKYHTGGRANPVGTIIPGGA